VPALSSLLTHKVIKAFARDGWILRQGGKHMVLTKPGYPDRLVIPRHRTVKHGLLLRQIKNASLTAEAFLKLYNA